MARLTLQFKDKTLQVLDIEAEAIGIGRDPDNALCIDSLAVAPHHAQILKGENGGIEVRPVDSQHKVFVNDQPITEHKLSHGDRITLGKHEVIFTEAPGREPSTLPSRGPASVAARPQRPVAEAGLQLLNGANMGLVVSLRNALTRLGRDESGTAIIARRKEGYFLSALTLAEAIAVNEQPVEDLTVHLKHQDVIKIGPQLFRFHER